MQVVKNQKDSTNTKQQKINFTFEDHVSKVTLSKNTSPKMLQLLNKCDFQCDVIVKGK